MKSMKVLSDYRQNAFGQYARSVFLVYRVEPLAFHKLLMERTFNYFVDNAMIKNKSYCLSAISQN